MRKLAGLIANIPEAIAGLTMLAITVILFAGVIWRYFLVDPLTWSDEIARALFVWLVFIGAAIGVKRRMHASVSVLSALIPAQWHRVTTIIGLVAIGLMAAVLLYKGAIETAANFKQVMPVTGLSRGWLYLGVPVSGLLMLVYLIPQMWDAIRGVPLRSAHEHQPQDHAA